MAPCPRKDIIDSDVVGIYHCVSRCVRRAFLCGLELLTGRCFDHRQDWLEQGTARLAALFAIDVLDFCVMSNHIHHVLRNRPDIVERWSDEEVVRRWWQICPMRKEPDGSPSEVIAAELQMRLSDKDLVQELRRRLSSISWFMKLLKEPIAKRASREDKVSGFFLGRSFSQHTASGLRRRAGLQHLRGPEYDLGRAGDDAGGFPLHVGLAPHPGPALGERHSLELLDWTGRQVRDGKGRIPEHLAPIMERLGIAVEQWTATIESLDGLPVRR